MEKFWNIIPKYYYTQEAINRAFGDTIEKMIDVSKSKDPSPEEIQEFYNNIHAFLMRDVDINQKVMKYAIMGQNKKCFFLEMSAIEAIAWSLNYKNQKKLRNEYISYFIDKGADPNARSKEGRALIHVLLQTCKGDDIDLALFEKLLKHGMDPNLRRTIGTPLYFAAKLENSNLVKLLIKHKGNIDKTDGQGLSPLGRAIFNNDSIATVQILCDNNASLRKVAEYQKDTAFHFAVHNLLINQKNYIGVLIKHERFDLDHKADKCLEETVIGTLLMFKELNSISRFPKILPELQLSILEQLHYIHGFDEKLCKYLLGKCRVNSDFYAKSQANNIKQILEIKDARGETAFDILQKNLPDSNCKQEIGLLLNPAKYATDIDDYVANKGNVSDDN